MQGIAEAGWPGVAGCHEGSEQSVVQLGVEDGHADAVGREDVLIGVLDPADEPGEAEAAQVVGRLRGV
jgi:hypothetical protein